MEIKEIIAKNIVDLRKAKKWTQMELAEKVHYTDKAVSKWERAESTPDVDALFELSKIFGVTVDYFFHEQKENKAKFILDNAINWFKKMMWLFIFSAALLLAALTVFIVGYYLKWPNMWIAFIWTTPFIAGATTFFFIRIRNWLGELIASCSFVWCLITALYFEFLMLPPNQNLSLLFLAGIPVTGAIVLFFFILLDKKKKKDREFNAK
mgnify:CR=1 FL=1